MLRRNRAKTSSPLGGIQFDTSDSEQLAHEIQEWISCQRQALGDILLELEFVDKVQLDFAELQRIESGADLPSTLIGLGFLNDDQLAQARAIEFQIPYVDLRTTVLDPAAVEIVGEAFCRKWNVLPVRTNGDRVFIASAQLDNPDAIEALTQKCKRIGLLAAAQSELERQIHERFDALSETAVYAQAFELADDSALDG